MFIQIAADVVADGSCISWSTSEWRQLFIFHFQGAFKCRWLRKLHFEWSHTVYLLMNGTSADIHEPVWNQSEPDHSGTSIIMFLGLIHSCESSHSLYHLAHFLSCIISQSPAPCSSNYNAKLHFPCLRLNGADAVIFTWLETPMDAQTNTLTIMMSSIDKLTCFLCTKCHTLRKPRVKTGL